jgi:tape measure domain-containing protein
MGQPIDTAEVEIVPDFSDFARQLKAGIDRAMRDVQTSITQAFARVEDAAGRAGADVGREFQSGGERAEMAFREMSTVAKREFAEVDVAAGVSAGGLSSKFAGALGLVKAGLIGVGLAAGAGLAAMTAFGLKSAASLEQSTVAFTSLLHSAEEAKSFLTQLQDFSAATPFEFQQVVGASQRLLVLTQSLGQTKDAVIPLLTTIGDLVSVTGGSAESIDSVVRALSQMASKGKVSQEEIMQLAEALPGFNANAAIAGQLGLSVSDTLALITAGGVDATTGINALVAGMSAFPGAAGAMAAQAGTLTGVFSTFKDTIGIALTGAFQPVIPEIKSALSELTPVIGAAVGQLAPSLGGALSAILPLVGKLIQGIVPILTPILDALGPVLDAIGPALVPLGEAIGELVVALAPVLPVLAEFIGVLALLAIPIIKQLANVLAPLTPVLNYMAKAIGEVGKALAMINWHEVGQAIVGWTVDAWNAVVKFFHGIGDFFDKLPTWATMAGTDLRNKLLSFLGEVVAYVQSLPGRFFDALGSAIGGMIQAGKDLVGGIWSGIQSMGSWLWNKVSGFVYDNTIGAAKRVLGIHSPSSVFADQVGTQIPAGIAEGVNAGMADLQGLISPIVPSGSGAAAAGGGIGGITINVNVNGSATADDARRIGAAAGEGVLAALRRRNIGLAVRTA